MVLSASSPQALLPARRLPLLYLGFAHACLFCAFAVLALWPGSFSGFFYSPRGFAVVHLVTLGFVGASILGSIFLVAPLALRLPLPPLRLDSAAFAAYAIGVAGMVSHFWIDRPLGMLWAAPLPFLAIAQVAVRVLRGLPRAPVPGEVRLLVALAFANMLLAGGLGLFLGLNKLYGLAPVAPVAGVIAHAHLAGVGWGAMLVMGAGRRLLPMFLPAAMPRGRLGYAAAALTEAGLVGLAGSLLLRGEAGVLWPVLLAAGPLLFLAEVAGMLLRPKPAPSQLRRPDWATAQALQGLACLLVTLALGLFLALAPAADETRLGLAKVYGVLGLVGFLAQVVLGVQGRLLPMAAWIWSFAEGGYRELPASLHDTPSRALQRAGFLIWTAGVPMLAVAVYADGVRLTSWAASLLGLAVLASAANGALVLRRSRERHPPPTP